jgi:hypothetical protein
VKLSWRAAGRKAFSPLSEGRRGTAISQHEKNWGMGEKACFAGKPNNAQ